MSSAATLLAEQADRPGPGRLLADQVGYTAREMWRSRVVLIFIFVLPLVWLALIGIVAGNEVIDEATGLRVMQFVTPTAIVMGVMFASFPPVANSLALAREQRILKRFRGTPLPTWAYLVGKVLGAVAFAILAVLLMLVVSVLGYDVQIVWRTSVATVVTLAVGIAALAAMGLAVGSLARSASLAETISIAGALGLAFISGMFLVGATFPTWLERLAEVFPVRHLVTALQDQFNPYLSGSGWDPGALAVMGAWAVGAVGVAIWGLRREPGVQRSATATRATATGRGLEAAQPGRPAAMAVAFDQTRWANRGAWRDPALIAFAIAMPVGLYLLIATMYGAAELRPGGYTLTFFFACGMIAYGVSVTAFINMPGAVATARDRRVLKRLRGTPLAPWQYLVGRTASVVWIGVLTAAIIVTLAVVVYDVEVAAAGLPLALGVVVLGALTMAACGYALLSLMPNAKAMGAVGLGILLPLSFFSDVFIIGGAPEWMGTVGSLFPLRHYVYALAAALDPAGSVPWTNLAVMVAWMAVATAIAVRRFRWE